MNIFSFGRNLLPVAVAGGNLPAPTGQFWNIKVYFSPLFLLDLLEAVQADIDFAAVIPQIPQIPHYSNIQCSDLKRFFLQHRPFKPPSSAGPRANRRGGLFTVFIKTPTQSLAGRQIIRLTRTHVSPSAAPTRGSFTRNFPLVNPPCSRQVC